MREKSPISRPEHFSTAPPLPDRNRLPAFERFLRRAFKMLRRTSRSYNTRHIQLLKCHQQTLHRRVKVPKCLEFRYHLVSFSDSCPLVALSALFGLRKRCLNVSQRWVVTFDSSLLLLVGHTITSQLGDRSKGNMEGTLVTQRETNIASASQTSV